MRGARGLQLGGGRGENGIADIRGQGLQDGVVVLEEGASVIFKYEVAHFFAGRRAIVGHADVLECRGQCRCGVNSGREWIDIDGGIQRVPK